MQVEEVTQVEDMAVDKNRAFYNFFFAQPRINPSLGMCLNFNRVSAKARKGHNFKTEVIPYVKTNLTWSPKHPAPA